MSNQTNIKSNKRKPSIILPLILTILFGVLNYLIPFYLMNPTLGIIAMLANQFCQTIGFIVTAWFVVVAAIRIIRYTMTKVANAEATRKVLNVAKELNKGGR